MNRNIVEKFFANQTTPEETEQVLDWFETFEGKQYLRKRLDVDYGLMDRSELRTIVPELDSEEMYKSIQQNIQAGEKERGLFSLKRTDWLGYTVKTAAAILVIVTASVFTTSHERYVSEQVVERTPIVFQAENEQHREVTLGDGTTIRLNSNSEMIVSKDFMHGTREITLTGEAYFDVAHDPEQPFIIHANESSVEVLGTAFNVRSQPGQNNVQVAVVEGRVAFRSTNRSQEAEQLAVTLVRGQYGYMDITQRTLQVDDMAVENYLAWKNGRFVFEGLTLAQVCLQLNRIYGIECSFESKEITNLHLTSNFSNDSLDKTMEVIAMSLDIGYEMDGDGVFWRQKNSGSQK